MCEVGRRKTCDTQRLPPASLSAQSELLRALVQLKSASRAACDHPVCARWLLHLVHRISLRLAWIFLHTNLSFLSLVRILPQRFQGRRAPRACFARAASPHHRQLERAPSPAPNSSPSSPAGTEDQLTSSLCLTRLTSADPSAWKPWTAMTTSSVSWWHLRA